MKKHNLKKTFITITIFLLFILSIGFNIKASESENPTAIIDTNKGTIKVELYLDKVPNTVINFINLAQDGFYDGLVFHRVIDDFMIQGGGFTSDGTQKQSPYSTINLEISPDVRHVDGAIAMARTNDPNSATSQFYICDGTQSFLDDNYAAFGATTDGIEVVRAIASVETTTKHGMNDWPQTDVIINSITIEGYSEAINKIQGESNTITDQKGDVIYYHGQTGDKAFVYEYYQGLEQDIDITEVSIKIENEKIVLSLKTAGKIVEGDDYYQYNVFYTSNEASCSFMFSNNTMTALYIITNVKGGEYDSYAINGNTISVIFNASVLGINNVDLYGFTYKLTNLVDSTIAEHWSDYAPKNKEPTATKGTPYLEEDNGSNSNGSPGFELIVVFIAITFLLYVKKKNNFM